MVMILPEVPSFGKQFAQSLGRGLESGLGESMHMGRQLALEKYKRGLEAQQNLAALQAKGYNDPNFVNSFKPPQKDYVSLGQNTPNAKTQNISQQQDQSQKIESEAPFYSSEEEDKFIQQATRIKSDLELQKEARAEAYRRNAMGQPATYDEVLAEKVAANERAIKEQARLQPYSDLAKDTLAKAFKVYSEKKDWKKEDYERMPSQEVFAAFSKYATDLAFAGVTPAQIEKKLAEVAGAWSSAYDNIQKTGARQSGFKKLNAYLSGTSKTLPEQISFLSQQLKPFTDFGLFQEARKLAKEAGYGAEETALALEKIGVAGVNEPAQEILAKLPDYTRKMAGRRIEESIRAQTPLKPEQKNEFESNLYDVLDNDPNASLVLLRSKYMKKGVPWKDFKDAVYQYNDTHQVPLTRKRQDELAIINEPPLSVLDELMYQFGLIGK